jgi:outer membrane protein OmpA-like peptidoglycan-associated protein
MVIEEFETTEWYPFLPLIYFPEGVADLSQTRMRLLTASQTASFSEDALRSRDILVLYKDMLNVLGQRMRKFPRANIEILGINSDVGLDASTNNLAINRAEAVKNYLVNV